MRQSMLVWGFRLIPCSGSPIWKTQITKQCFCLVKHLLSPTSNTAAANFTILMWIWMLELLFQACFLLFVNTPLHSFLIIWISFFPQPVGLVHFSIIRFPPGSPVESMPGMFFNPCVFFLFFHWPATSDTTGAKVRVLQRTCIRNKRILVQLLMFIRVSCD